MIEYLASVFSYILQGTGVTLLVFTLTFLFSLPLGLLGAILKKSKIKPLVTILDFYTWLIRGTPLLLQLFFVVYGLPILFGSRFLFDELTGAIVTFIINYTAYFIEIFRGGMNSIHRSQYEASQVLSLNPLQSFFYVIFPQTIKKTLPSIINETITLIKPCFEAKTLCFFEH